MANNIAIAITADVADLTAKLAVAKVTMADTAKSMRASAQSVAGAGGWTEASDEMKRAAMQTAEAHAAAASQVKIYERALRAAQAPVNDNVAASGQMKFAMRDLAFQVNDVATMFTMGAPPMQIFAAQGGQVIGALQMMTGEAKGVLGVLGGPWGMMAASATMVLAPFIAKLFETKGALEGVGNAAQIAMDKLHQSLANASAVTDAATEATKKYVQASADLGKAQRDLARTQGANDMGMAAGPFAAGVQSEASKAAADARARIEKAKKDLADAKQMFSDIDAMGNAAAIQAANRAKIRDAPSLARKEEQEAKRAAREQAAEARKSAKERERDAKQAAQEALQERIAVNQHEDTLAEDRAQTDIALSRIALQAKLADIATEARAGTLSGAQAVQVKAKVNAELMQLDQDLEDRLFAAKLKQLQADRSNYRAGTKEYAAYTRQIEVLEAQHQNRMAVLKAQAAAKNKVVDDRIESERDRRMKSISASWAGELARMATLQQGFGATVTGIWQAVQGAVASVIQQMLTDWIAAHIFKLAATKTEAATTATAQAALAGAGGVASMAAAPFPINLGAPAFGAAMFATSAAYGSLASFAAGTNQLPNDMIAQVHAGERIVPKADNQALLELTRRGAGLDRPGARSGGGSGGGTVVNMTIQALDGPSVRRLLLNNGDKLAAAVAAATRNGWRPRGGNR